MSKLREAYGRLTGSHVSLMLRNMTLDGDPAGNSNGAVDGSTTPVKLYIQPLLGQEIEVVQVSIEISDSGNPDLTDYGNVVGPLLNGLQFFIEISGQEVLVFNPIHSNRELIDLGPVVERSSFSGSTSVALYSFNIWDHATIGQLLNGNNGDKFGVILQDDLSSLIAHTFVCKGDIHIKSVS